MTFNTLEEVFTYVNDKLLPKWCSETTININPRKHKNPSVSFHIVLSGVNTITLCFTTRYGTFDTGSFKAETVYYKVQHITLDALTNLLIHSLTFSHSPYVFRNGKFHRNVQVLG